MDFETRYKVGQMWVEAGVEADGVAGCGWKEGIK